MQISSRVRVVFVGHTAQLGGGELALLHLVANLDRERVDPSVVLFADGPLKRLLEKYVPVTVCPLSEAVVTTRKDGLGIRSLTKYRDISATVNFLYRLRRLLMETSADVVHTNSLKADVLGGIAARLAGATVIWHVRDRIADDYLPVAAVKVFRWLARIIPQYVIANSEAALSTLYDKSAQDGDLTKGERSFRARCSVVHDGIPNLVPSRPPVTKREHAVVGLVGRISPWKGQDVFLAAAAKVVHRYPSTIFRIIGAPLFGEDAYQEKLLSLCRTLGITENVEFTGFVSEIAAEIEDLDILVHASVLAEPFGQVIIEGMAAGKPVIATNGGGVPEIVVDGVTGLLVPMKDAEAMAEALVFLLGSEDARSIMGSNGKQRVAESFRIETTARKVESVYDHLLSGSRDAAGTRVPVHGMPTTVEPAGGLFHREAESEVLDRS